jgi:dihydrofolate synthase / folylpolyglutamate synthase
VTTAPRVAGYQDALEYLFARTTGGVKFGLERTTALLEHLGNPQRRYPTLHVAGTNGKGSSVATMASLLAATGRRVATYTSPHLIDFRERMVVGGEPIPADAVLDFITRHISAIERIGATFFEATTAMAFDHFAQARADIAVIETGLGGRLDSTNVILPLAAGVTSIGFDHTEYLGSTLDEIALEKAGIFKPGRAAVIGERQPDIRDLLAKRAEAAGASSVHVVDQEMRVRDVTVDDDGTTCELEWRGESARVHTPLSGRHQAHNLAFSLVMLDAAGPEFSVGLDEAARHTSSVRVPGRFQHVGQFIFDVAHNPDGISVLVQTLAAVQPPRPIAVVLCVLRDKDWREMMRRLGAVTSQLVLTMSPTAPDSRAWNLSEAAEYARSLGYSVDAISDFDAALARAQVIARTVLVTGSFHTVGDAMARLQVSPLAG